MRKVRVFVTEEDITDGMPGIGTCCAVALATARALEATRGFGDGQVSVGYDSIFIDHREYEMPRHVFLFARLFDGRYRVSPIEFELEVL